VVKAARQRALVLDAASHFEAVPGHGVRASVGGRTVLVGNRKLLERNGVAPGLEREAEMLRAEAKTALYVAADGKMIGLIAVTDAPALAAATVGIAIGAGTDVAIETAGIILMKDDPADVPAALVLARRVHRKIKQNLFWAAIYNLIAIPLAAGVLYPSLGILLKPAWAALAMSASTVTVTVNALLLQTVSEARNSD